MFDEFEYSSEVPAEGLSKYCPGGYHPVYIGDVFNAGRYQILQKLGFGGFSTAWLARDNLNQSNVSIKIVVADHSEAQSRELGIMQHIKEKGDSNHPGCKHVSQFLDFFHHEGPNGRHLCVVMEPLGPDIFAVAERSTNYRLDGHLARRISRQVLLAVDYLHSCGVAHGDIHLGNVLFRLPGADHASRENVLQRLGSPVMGKVTRKDGAPLEKGVPEYLVEPVEYDRKDCENLEQVQLVDFGEAFLTSNPPESLTTPVPFHPPELVFHHALTEAVDMWNLGCMTYDVVIGRTPFEADFEDHRLVPQFQKVLGGVPEQWILDALDAGVLAEKPDASSADGFLPLEEDIIRSYRSCFDDETLQLTETDLGSLVLYLRKLLVIDPTLRGTPSELLAESWVAEAALGTE